MAKREFIETREIVYVNAPIAPILQGDSIHYEDIAFKTQIGRIHTFSEQDIVKPYLEKLKAMISEVDLNKVAKNYEDRFYGFQNEILQMIDNLLSESEGEE